MLHLHLPSKEASNPLSQTVIFSYVPVNEFKWKWHCQENTHVCYTKVVFACSNRTGSFIQNWTVLPLGIRTVTGPATHSVPGSFCWFNFLHVIWQVTLGNMTFKQCDLDLGGSKRECKGMKSKRHLRIKTMKGHITWFIHMKLRGKFSRLQAGKDTRLILFSHGWIHLSCIISQADY